MNLEIEVECHQVVINQVYLLHDEDSVKVLMIDFQTKYPQVVAYAGHKVLFGSGEGTLHDDKEDLDLSAVLLKGLSEDQLWIVEATICKYTGFVFYFKGAFQSLKKRRNLLWSRTR